MTLQQTASPALAGRLDPLRAGASMPVDAPYYQAPPFYYRDARSLAVAFETDPAAAQAILPEGLELTAPVRASLSFLHYPFSTFGPYYETILGLECSWRGAPRYYIAHIAVDTVPPMVAGREIWGYPKKLAHITLEQDTEFLTGTIERPAGTRLATLTARLERPLEIPTGGGGGGGISLRVIPSAEAGQPPALAELVETITTDTVTHEVWAGTATVRFDAHSALDPWHCLPVQKLLGATYRRYDFTLPAGRVIKRY